MTVTWITRIPCAGGIDYREKGAENWTRRWPMPDRFPFVDCFLDTSDVITCDVSPEKLLVKAHNYNKKDGSLHDAFEIYPDGTVKDAAEGVRAYPIPEYKPKKGK